MSINSSTGVVTITSSAQGGIVQLKATCDSVSATVNLTLTDNNVTSVQFDQSSYSANVPASGSTTVTVSAKAYNKSNVAIPGVNITYSLVQAYTGVSINSSTGVVTINSTNFCMHSI